jgi:hypothetical protein
MREGSLAQSRRPGNVGAGAVRSLAARAGRRGPPDDPFARAPAGGVCSASMRRLSWSSFALLQRRLRVRLLRRRLLVPDFPFDRLSAGAHNHMPFVMGTTAHEYAHRFEAINEATYVALLADLLKWEVGSPELNQSSSSTR